MLWLALYFPQLPLELFARDLPDDRALAVSHRQGGRDLIARCNEAAAQRGVHPGMALQAALALCETLRVRPRDPRAERQALEDLALWAYQFSAHICFEPALLLLEIGASVRLFSGLDALLQGIRRQVDSLQHRRQWALAPTPMAAALLARCAPGCRVLQTAQLPAALAPIPLARFTREPALRKLVADLGLRNLGECLALPRPELARRSGPELLLLFDRLLGRAPDPREPWRPPERFEQKLELPGEVAHQHALAFPARRLILALCGYLRGRGAGTQRLHWTLQHREQPPTCFEQGLLRPSREPEHILALFRERIERLRLAEPAVLLQLRVDDCLPFEERSGELLAESLPQQDRQLLERLRNRLGEDRVHGLRALPDHRPERAWQLCEPGQAGATAGTAERLPPWLLHQPQPLRLHGDRPVWGGPLQLQGPPQRIESGWWDGFEVARDYFLAQNPDGERLWVYRDRRSGEWFLHGIFG